MKKIFISAVLTVLFASCSTEDAGTESIQKGKAIQTMSQISWGNLIDDIENSCQTTTSYTSKSQLITHVERVALSKEGFVALVNSDYTSPTVAELDDVMHKDAMVLINEMNYSTTAKKYLKELLVDHTPWEIDPLQNTELQVKEVKMLQFLVDYNDPDDSWNGRKPLAFVYGHQQGAARAVVFTVLAHEFIKVR